MKPSDLERFSNLTFADFRKLANDNSLSPYEKIGFPNEYRAGKEEQIFADILGKLPTLLQRGKLVVDIGPGCSGLATHILTHCQANAHQLIAVDSPEMLQHLPNAPFITKVPGRFPEDTSELLRAFHHRIDVVITYSVFHYIYAESNPFLFIDRALELLVEGGTMLIGDVPNISKRKRFFSSTAGIQYHQGYTQQTEHPTVVFNSLDTGKIDDGVLIGILHHCRSAGFDAYLVPQGNELPMANRREDLLIKRP